jgi:hypothetical protein
MYYCLEYTSYLLTLCSNIDMCVFGHSQKPCAPLRSTSFTLVCLDQVKDYEEPVPAIPLASAYESSYHLRSKVLQQRHKTLFGTTPYGRSLPDLVTFPNTKLQYPTVR